MDNWKIEWLRDNLNELPGATPFWCNVCRPSHGLLAPCLDISKKKTVSKERQPSSCDILSL